jgi:serine/threonine protein kinase
MALEVIRGETYDRRCDWWSVGIVLYEVSSTSLLRQWLSLNESFVSVRMYCKNRTATKERILVSPSYPGNRSLTQGCPSTASQTGVEAPSQLGIFSPEYQ